MFNIILIVFNLISNSIANFLLNSSNFLNFLPIWLMLCFNIFGVVSIIIVGPLHFVTVHYNLGLKLKFLFGEINVKKIS